MRQNGKNWQFGMFSALRDVIYKKAKHDFLMKMHFSNLVLLSYKSKKTFGFT
jgi:hypothetical protein